MTGTAEALRCDVAAATRMLTDLDILNYSGHISARIDGSEHFLIQVFDDVRSTLVPDRLLVVDLDGNVVEGKDGVSSNTKPPIEVFIHSEILRARPDVGAVAHFHHDPTTVFSMVSDRPLVAMKNHASRWMAGVPVHPDPSHINSPAKGREVVATLGDAEGLLLRAHGQVLVAENLRALFADSVHFVENASTLALAAQIGSVAALSRAEQQRFLDVFDRAKHAQKLWRYYTATAHAGGLLPGEWLDQS